jgi:hypothetical protein
VRKYLKIKFILLLILFSCNTSKNNEWTKTDFVKLIKDKTNLELSEDFKIIRKSIEHTEEAFDSDYTIGLIIEYKESDEENITEQILKSMKSKSEKGRWINYANGFDFEHSNNDINSAEPFYLKVDTLNNKLELSLSHL